MFTTAFLSWIGFSLFVMALGLALGNVVLLTGAVFIIITALMATALSQPAGIAVERELPKLTCWAGDTLDIRRQVRASGGMGPVFVHDPLPAEVEVVEGNNLRVVWKWPGPKTADLSYRVRFPKRGRYVLDETRWDAQAPLGINRGRSGTGGSNFEVSVAPRIRGITRMNEVRAMTKNQRYQDDLTVIGTSAADFRELRPYMPGDPIKSINWKATARGAGIDNIPLVNELEPEGRKAAWIFLDTADYMNVGSPLSNPMENTIEAAGSLAQYFLSKGSTLGAYAYNNLGGPGELLAPDSGRRQFRQLTQMLTGLRSGPPRHDLLQAVEWCKGFLFRLQPEVFTITRLDIYYDRPEGGSQSFDRFTTAIRRLMAFRTRSGRGGRVRIVHVGPGGTGPGLTQAPAGPDLSRWEARPMAAALRRSGADVIEWEPDREDFIAALVRHMNAYR